MASHVICMKYSRVYFFKMMFEKANRIYLTRVDAEPEADAFFPEIDPTKWKLVSRQDHHKDEKNEYDYSFQVWEKNSF